MKSNTEKTLTFFTTKFDELLKEIAVVNWKTSLLKCSKEYQIKCYKIQWLSPPKIKEIYQSIAHRYYLDQNVTEDCWHQNELRVFIWTLLTWSQSLGIKPDNLNQKHWERLSEILNFKSIKLLEFQYQNIKKLRVRVQKWSEQQDQILLNIIKYVVYQVREWQNKKISWNQVSKNMYYRTSQKIFRPPKQCRQRWNNYLDPCKQHGDWTLQEDKKLIDSIIKFGKRWAMIGKHLEDKRTQHMVKNRYNSLLSKFKKQNPQLKQSSQNTLIGHINKKLNGQILEQYESSQQFEQLKQQEAHDTIVDQKQTKTLQRQKQQQKNPNMISNNNIMPLAPATLSIKKTSKLSEEILGSPRMIMTPGYNTGFFSTLTPFLISPSVGNNQLWKGSQQCNYFAFENFSNNDQ